MNSFQTSSDDLLSLSLERCSRQRESCLLIYTHSVYINMYTMSKDRGTIQAILVRARRDELGIISLPPEKYFFASTTSSKPTFSTRLFASTPTGCVRGCRVLDLGLHLVAGLHSQPKNPRCHRTIKANRVDEGRSHVDRRHLIRGACCDESFPTKERLY